MKYVRIVKRKTFDGLFEIKDDVPLGKVYEYDEKQSISMGKFFNVEKGIQHEKQMCWVRTPNEKTSYFFPVELLDWATEGEVWNV